jgi:hypothetical protein
MPIILATQEGAQESGSLKPAQANSSWDPILKKLITKKDWWNGVNSKRDCLASVRPWVQTPCTIKKKKNWDILI